MLYLERLLVLYSLEVEIAEKLVFNSVRKMKSAPNRVERLQFEYWDSLSMFIICQTLSKLKKTAYSGTSSENFKLPRTSLEKSEMPLRNTALFRMSLTTDSEVVLIFSEISSEKKFGDLV